MARDFGAMMLVGLFDDLGRYASFKWCGHREKVIIDGFWSRRDKELEMRHYENHDAVFRLPLENITSIQRKGYKRYCVHYSDKRILYIKFRNHIRFL